METEVTPRLESVMVWGELVTPMGCWAKPRLFGEKTTTETTLPDKLTVFGPIPLSETIRDAVLSPPAVGPKVTLIEQLAFTGREEPQSLFCAKSAELSPCTWISVMLRACDPRLF